MKYVFFLLLAFSLICSAQEITSSSSFYPQSSSAADSQIECPEVEYHGMQTNEYIPYEPYIIKWDEYTINFSGIIDSIGVDSFLVDGKYTIRFTDSSKTAAKIVKLVQVNMDLADNPMKEAFDSNFVYVPLDFKSAKGDSIFIKNYSASIFLDCSSPYTEPYGFFMGEFSSHSNSDVMNIKRPNYKTDKIPSKNHNRNASGKFITQEPSKIIRY